LPDPLELAGLALEHASGEALAAVTHERSLTLRFAAGRPTQATAIDDVTVELAVVRDGQVGRAATNVVQNESLATCAKRATGSAEAAVAAAGAGSYPGFPQPAAGRPHDGHDPETAALDPARGGGALAEAFELARGAGLEAHGVWTAAENQRTVASSSGAGLHDRTTDAFMKVICIAPNGRSGYAARTAVASGHIEAAALAERAARKATTRERQATLKPGKYDVVLEAHAVGALLDLLGGTAFNGLAHAEGRGALAGRLRHRVASPAVNLSDSPSLRDTLPRAFDAEGTPKAPLPLIQDGVAHRVVHDSRSAALDGARSTGHALAPGGAPDGPPPTNLVLAGGGAADEAELCAPVERGVYVTRLWYTNVVRPKETLITAVTRDGTFLIEDGRLGRPLQELRITDRVLGILERTQALGARQQLTSDGEFYGRRFAFGVLCPPLRAGAVRFTGSVG
jgi:PmbA protein